MAKYEHTCLVIRNSEFCEYSVKGNLEKIWSFRDLRGYPTRFVK